MATFQRGAAGFGPTLAGRQISLAVAAGLAAAMGVGRFVFTPILPIMVASAGISAQDGAIIATGNYAGYLAGAVLLTRLPQLSRRTTFIAWSLVLVVSEAAMALSANLAFLTALRFAAGLASAAIFIACASTIAHHRQEGASAGLAFAGVGVGIAITGVFTLVAGRWLSWQQLWFGAAVLTMLLLWPAWLLDIRNESGPVGDTGAGGGLSSTPVAAAVRRSWRLLVASYFSEGVGYIIVGTFLVAAVASHAGRQSPVGALLWTAVGLAAVPATMLWNAVAHRVGSGPALTAALVIQSAGIAAAALSDSLVAELAAAVAFGATFMGVSMLTLEAGARLGVPRAAASLTAAYAVGQMLGPLVVAPVLGSSYRVAFVIAAGLVAGSAALATAAARARQGITSDPEPARSRDR